MRVAIYVVDQGKQHLAGTLELRDGKVVAVPRTDNIGDKRTLEWAASRTIYVLLDGQDVWIKPDVEPAKFLTWLHRGLTGTMVRAGKAEESN